MPVFVHLASHRDLRSIRRGGIRPPKGGAGVYALPVTRNFYVSHQWLRELRRHGGGTMLGVYFRVPDDERVEVGHFNSHRVPMTAAQAAGLMLEAEGRAPAAAAEADRASKAVRNGRRLPSSPEGYEVVIPRAIAPTDILRVKALPQVVGWRYRPGSHGARPCACLCCERGSFGIRRLLRGVEKAEAKDRDPKVTFFSRDDASYRRVERLRARRHATS